MHNRRHNRDVKWIIGPAGTCLFTGYMRPLPALLSNCGGVTHTLYKTPAADGQRGWIYFALNSQAAGIGCFSNCGPLISITGDSPCHNTQGVG